MFEYLKQIEKEKQVQFDQENRKRIGYKNYNKERDWYHAEETG